MEFTMDSFKKRAVTMRANMVYLLYLTVFLIQAAWGLESRLQSPTYVAPPQVTITEPEVTIGLGESKSFTCTPEGSPLPTVQWAKANGEFRDGVTQNGNNLVITDARKEDEGHYVCRGIVEGTTVWTDYSVIRVVEKPPQPTPAPIGPPKVTVSNQDVNITKGENGTITCTPEGFPLPRVQWAKANGEFRVGVIQIGNTLIISDAREEDENFYLCRGIVEGTTIWTDYSVVHVVEKPPQPTPAPVGPPRVTVSERLVNITEGESRTITCTPEGFPLPTVQWEKVYGKFRDGVIQDGNNLVITRAVKEDEGVYWCRGIVKGNTVWVAYSDVRVLEKIPPPTPAPVGPPTVTVSEREVKVIRGENRTITCTPGGFPVPRVQWAKANGEFRDGVTQSGNTLIISVARDEDTSHYVCRGIVEGTTVWTDYALVEVIDKPQNPPKVTVGERTVKIPEGQSRAITCRPEGSPLPIVRWTKSNGKFRFGVGQTGNTLVIPAAQPEDRGLYVCNGIVDGKVVSLDYTIVEIIDKPQQPPKVTVGERTVKIPEGGSRAITCRPEGSPLPLVLWTKSNGKFRFGVRQTGTTLAIPVARTEDQGIYVCNGIVNGKVVSWDYTSVEIIERPPQPSPSPNGPPTVAVSEREVKIVRGGAKTLYCAPKGTPLPKVVWAKADGKFRDGVRQYGNTLTIINAQLDDEAHYVCQGIVDGTVIGTDYAKVEVVGGI